MITITYVMMSDEVTNESPLTHKNMTATYYVCYDLSDHYSDWIPSYVH